mmetsp:Transcript_34755/g.75998  ORF Transcript_34755/g.75998 Transcript_34755/m.75998 type:complete len:209 (-) Transcript_34755:267-893(-)
MRASSFSRPLASPALEAAVGAAGAASEVHMATTLEGPKMADQKSDTVHASVTPSFVSIATSRVLGSIVRCTPATASVSLGRSEGATEEATSVPSISSRLRPVTRAALAFQSMTAPLLSSANTGWCVPSSGVTSSSRNSRRTASMSAAFFCWSIEVTSVIIISTSSLSSSAPSKGEMARDHMTMPSSCEASSRSMVTALRSLRAVLTTS